MFIYFVAVVATIFLIFGLLHVRSLPANRTPLRTEDLAARLSERPVTFIRDRAEYEDLPTHKTQISVKGKLPSDIFFEESGSRLRTTNVTRHSLEDILSEEKDRDLGLPGTRNLQLGKTHENAVHASIQEGKENILETLKQSIEKSTPYNSPRLNTTQIYNLLVKETLKENEAKQKLLDNNRSKSNEATREHMASSSENKNEQDDVSSK